MRLQVAVIAVLAFCAGAATIYAASREVSAPEPQAVPAIRIHDSTPVVQRGDTARERSSERSRRSERRRKRRGRDDRRSGAGP
nr:hypothetical protein [Solirubrobacterales bacterium]